MRRCRAFHHGTKSCVAVRSGISLSAVPMLNGWWLAANAFFLIVFGTNLRVIRRKSTKQPESITLRFMRNRADNVTEVMITNSGHWLMEEQPAATIAAVHNFLDRKTTTQSN